MSARDRHTREQSPPASLARAPLNGGSHRAHDGVPTAKGSRTRSYQPQTMPTAVEANLLSTLEPVSGAAVSIAEGHKTPNLTPTSPIALAGDTFEGAEGNHAADRIPDGPACAHEDVGGPAPMGENLVTLEEAVDDGTMINTTGTLIFTEFEALDLPETESHGGLLGHDRQDLYISMGLQATHGWEKEGTTRVQEALNGAVAWGSEQICIKCSHADDTVIAEVWNENPGSDVLIGKAVVTKRHMRALALLGDRCARIRLPLSRQRAARLPETRGILVARARLILDADVPRSKTADSKGGSLSCKSQARVKAAGRRQEPKNRSEASCGYLVCSGLTGYDLPPTEGLKFGGSQDPYVKITLGSTARRSNVVGGGGKLCDWTSRPLRWRVGWSHEEHHLWGQGLVVEVWNDNQPRADALIGRGLVRHETLRQLQQFPTQGGVSCRVKLSYQGKGRKATVGMVLTFEPDSLGVTSKEDDNREGKSPPRRPPEQQITVLVRSPSVKDLGDIMSFGFGALENVEFYLVARAGAIERATPAAAVMSGKVVWGDTCLALPLSEKSADVSSLLRLELWTSSPVQDDQVGYVEADLANLAFLPYEQNNGQVPDNDATASAFQSALELPMCLIDTTGEKFKDARPGMISCRMELRHRTPGSERRDMVSEAFQNGQSVDASPREDGVITLPMIGPTEGPGIVKATVVGITLHEEAEAPEVRLTLLPGKRFATTRPLLGVGGGDFHHEDVDTSVTSVCNQELEIPCYSMDFASAGIAVILQVDVIVAGVLAGQRVLGRGRVDISQAIHSREKREKSVDITSHERGVAPIVAGNVSISVRFSDAWETASNFILPKSKLPDAPRVSVAPLHCPGIVRVFVVEARELSGLKPQQDPYVVVERMAADPTIACQAKPYSSAVATISEGKNARWLESCDLRIGEAEADFLRNQPGGGSISFTVTLTDRDVRGGDESISSLEVVVTPGSLAEREPSVLWHRLFSQGRDRGFVRLGCCWVPADLEPVNVCGVRPEEQVEAGTLYLWLKEGRDLPNPDPTVERVRGLPPMCEIELRPYAKVGRKKAREVLGCARVPESDSPDLDTGVFHKFLKMDFAEVDPSEDKDLAEASPSMIVSVYTKLGQKRVVSGRAEILLASLCGYKNLNGEAVLRIPRRQRDAGTGVDGVDLNNKAGTITGHPLLRGAGKKRRLVLGEADADAFSCPVAAVEKNIPLVEDGTTSSCDCSHGDGGGLAGGGRGGELILRALYVPDRLADALGVRSAIKALSRAAEAAMHSFTQNPPLALPRADQVEAATAHDSDSQVLDVDTTALPGALEVYLIRATDLVLIEDPVDLVVQLQLVCSAGGELSISEMGRCNRTAVEWNHQCSLLVDDANVEMLEVLILDGCSPQRWRKPLARCQIPLMRYAQRYHAMQTLDIGQVTPERFKLTDHRGRGSRGHIVLSLNFLPETVGQAHILREAFAPTANLQRPHLPMEAAPHQLAVGDAAEQPKYAISVLIICMDGGDVSREDRVRVRVSLAGDSDDWRETERFGGATNPCAVSGVGVVDEEAAVCRWNRPGVPRGEVRAQEYVPHYTIELGGEEISSSTAPGELLTLPWDPRLALSAWRRGRASVLKFEISRGPGRPAAWTGFVPTAGLVHTPGSVFERAIPLLGRVGSEPPTSARTAASASASASASVGSRDDRPGVSLEVAMVFQPVFECEPILDAVDATLHRKQQPAPKVTTRTAYAGSTQSPFHLDFRRIPPEAGELVVHCLKARNLRLPRNVQRSPTVVLTAIPDGEEVETSTPTRGPGGRHPVWGQTRTLSISDAVTARVHVRVRDASQLVGDNVMGEVELSMAGIIAAEHGMAAAVTSGASFPEVQSSSGGSADGASLGVQEHGHNLRGIAGTGERSTPTTPRQRSAEVGELEETETPDNRMGEPVLSAKPDKVKPCGIEAWFPLFVPGRQGGTREREQVGEVRLACRFLSTDFMLQRELTAGGDEGDNGPIGELRYKLERRPGRLFLTIRCCRALPKAMIGERAPVVEARLRHGGWNSSTKRQVGLNPTFNERMVVEVLWTPRDLKSPELILDVKDKALGGGLLATIRIAIAPFILHPSMPAEIWCPLLRPGDTKAGIYCGLVYMPSPTGQQPNAPSPATNSVENVADPELIAISRQPRCGVVHVDVLSARGLPASSKDPQVGVRLRVGDGNLSPFQRTAAVRRGGREPQFNSTFLLGLRQDALGLEEQSKRVVQGRTPVLEVEVRCSRGRGNLLGTVDIPMFPLWFQGHMTRVWYPIRGSDGQSEAVVWYPIRGSDGQSEAGRVFLGLQFIAHAQGAKTNSSGLTAGSTQPAAGRRRFLFLEVRQGRDLRLANAFSGNVVVHLEMRRSGSRGKTLPANGTADPTWLDGAGGLALPYPTCRREGGGSGGVSEVLRITVLCQRDVTNDEQEDDLAGRVIGQCDWPLPAQDVELGRPLSSWHALWEGGAPAGAVYLRCRLGCEGEALDHTPSGDLRNDTMEETSAMSPLASGNYHVEFLKVRGFQRTLRRMGLASDNPSGDSPRQGNRLQWEGVAYLVETPGSGGEDGRGAALAPVGSGRAVAVGARGRDTSRSLCVEVSLAGGRFRCDEVAAKTLKAVSYVPLDKLVPILTVPGSELLEWFPAIDAKDGSEGSRSENEEADTGQVLLSVRYAPLAVGVLDVAVSEAQLACNTSPAGILKASTRILPAQTGGPSGHKVRSTPARRGVRTNLHDDQNSLADAPWGTVCSWEDASPHRMRFNNAFNKQPAMLHVSVIQNDRMLGFASVGVEAVVHDVMTTMAREITEGTRTPRGSAHDLGPVGLCDGDFGDPIQAWYPLKTSILTEGDTSSPITDGLEPSCLPLPLSPSSEIGRVRVEIKFAPHPKVLVKNWQEGAAVTRANGIAAMKAIFYRLNRSGNLVVDTEYLRLALVDAVESFLAKPAKHAREQNRAYHAGEFVLLVSQGIKSNVGTGRNVALSESAVDSVLTMMDRDRIAEVTFTEFCTFLSQAAAWQAEAAVGDLVNELAEDNDDENFASDSEDGALSCDGGKTRRDGQDTYDSGHVKHSPVRVTGTAPPLTHPPQPQPQPRPSPISVADDNHNQGSKARKNSQDSRRATPNTGKVSAGDPSSSQDSTRGHAPGRSKKGTEGKASTVAPVQEKTVTASDGYYEGIEKPARGQAAGREGHTLAGRQTRLPKDVTSWTVGQVLSWLSVDMQLPKHAPKFREASVDGLVLCNLTDSLLEEGLGMSDPLHRLKIVRHVQNLCRIEHHPQAYPREGSMRSAPMSTSPHRPRAARGQLSPQPRRNGVARAARARSPGGSQPQTEATSINDSRKKKSHPPVPPVLSIEGEDSEISPYRPSRSDARLIDGIEKGKGSPEISGEGGELHAATEAALSTDEAALGNTRNYVPGELVLGERLGQPEAVPSPSMKRRRQLPTNATTTEVHEVVQAAMWEAATKLEEHITTGNETFGPANGVEDDFPAAWWGSSDGGSTGKSEMFNGGESTRSGEWTSEQGGQTAARLLFERLCSRRPGAIKSPRPRGSGLNKLTRHRLEVGIRALLLIDMRWEQWQLFLDSITSLRTQGYLNLEEFVRAFAFHSFVHRLTTTPRGLPNPDDQLETTPSLAEFTPGLVEETTTGWQTTSTDTAELKGFVLGIAGTLRACRSTLGGIISTFDRSGDGMVSVSEFISLVKALTGKKRYSASARAWVGGFDRKQAYRLLRCVDNDGDRRVALRDLVKFVFATWTEELHRLSGAASGDDEDRQRRRQLQKDLRRNFPLKFRRALNLDEIKLDTVSHDPFSGLLTRLGLGLSAPRPPSPRSQPTLASPRRSHRENTSNRSSRDCANSDPDRSSCSDSVDTEAQGGQPCSRRNRPAPSIPTPKRPHGHVRPATSRGHGRPLGFATRRGRKQLRRCRSFEERMLSIPPRVDLSAVTLTSSHNRQLLAKGIFQTSGRRE